MKSWRSAISCPGALLDALKAGEPVVAAASQLCSPGCRGARAYAARELFGREVAGDGG
jgi:hypothetical protein